MARTTYGNTEESNRRADLTWQPAVDENKNMRKVPDRSKDFVEGYLVLVKENVGSNNSMIYQIQIAPDPKVPYTGFGQPGNFVDIWGCDVLDQNMEKFIADPKFGKGAWCRVEFDGRKLSKKGKAKPENQQTISDWVIIYSVIGDDEIPGIKIEGQGTSYKAVPSNAAPVVAQPAATVASVPVNIDTDNDDVDPDDLPF